MLMRSYSSVTVVSSAAMRTFFSAPSTWRAMALSFPPLQQNRMSSVMPASLVARGVLHAEAEFAAQRRVTVRLLVLLVGKIRDAAVESEPVGNVVRRRKIKPCIAGVHNLAGIVVVGALTGEIAAEVPIHS